MNNEIPRRAFFASLFGALASFLIGKPVARKHDVARILKFKRAVSPGLAQRFFELDRRRAELRMAAVREEYAVVKAKNKAAMDSFMKLLNETRRNVA